MQNLTRNEQIRGYIRGILAIYSGENLSSDNIYKIADELAVAVNDAIERWEINKEKK